MKTVIITIPAINTDISIKYLTMYDLHLRKNQIAPKQTSPNKAALEKVRKSKTNPIRISNK